MHTFQNADAQLCLNGHVLQEASDIVLARELVGVI